MPAFAQIHPRSPHKKSELTLQGLSLELTGTDTVGPPYLWALHPLIQPFGIVSQINLFFYSLGC